MWTKDEILEKCAFFRAMAIETFREHGEVIQMVFFFGTTPKKGVHICPVVSMGDEVVDDVSFVEVTRRLATEYGATSIAHLTEAWILTGEHALAYDGTESPSESANRSEALMLQLESQRFPMQLWQAAVERRGGRPTVAAWRQFPAGTTGRFLECLEQVS